MASRMTKVSDVRETSKFSVSSCHRYVSLARPGRSRTIGQSTKASKKPQRLGKKYVTRKWSSFSDHSRSVIIPIHAPRLSQNETLDGSRYPAQLVFDIDIAPGTTDRGWMMAGRALFRKLQSVWQGLRMGKSPVPFHESASFVCFDFFQEVFRPCPSVPIKCACDFRRITEKGPYLIFSF
jgi:hypothetical protein